jgi:hypothetical protein
MADATPLAQNPLITALGDEARSAAELTAALNCSQPTLSRLVRAAGAAVVTLGRAQQTRYARARNAGVEQPLAITRIDADGAPQSCGALYTIGNHSGGRTAWVAERRVEVFVGLPWFVTDMRPQGFLGRQFPARVPHLGLPPNVNDWADNHVLEALAVAGADEPGDLILGRAALDLFLQAPVPDAISARRKANAYAELARTAANQSHAFSSAGGEHSKFTAFVESKEGGAHVIVKFSPAGSDAIAQRWRDLLRCEHHALSVLAESTLVAAAESRVVESDRVYLEVRRYDRIGPKGRRGVVSLGAIDDEFVGGRQSWVQCAQKLQQLRMLAARDVERIALLQAFGHLIHNTDMHFGNCALLHDGPQAKQFTLAPIYDMLPMRFAPTAQGLREDEVPPVRPTADVLNAWPQAIALAREFWGRVKGDPAMSKGFVQIARAAMP